MASDANHLRWDGNPGHYEVYYVSLTDPASGWGLWIRYTMVAPLDPASAATASLWLMATRAGSAPLGRKVSVPVERMSAGTAPFELRIGDALLTDHGMTGGFEDVAWDLRWDPRLPAAEHVHPLLRKAKVAKTVLVLPHPDLAIAGTVDLPGERLELDGARGGQAHLWGSKHATRWAWAHCNDFTTLDGEPRPDTFVDGVSVVVPRFGREVGPSSPVVGRFLGDDFRATSPLGVLRATSQFGLTTWQFEAVAGKRKVVGDVNAARETLVGVTYHDPDGELAYCYNSEVASMRLHVWDRASRGPFPWVLRESLASDARAHFEYAQRTPVPELPIHVT
jgi:hypothetical protein